jgi:enamine deaminase RidA (YjgF/YER057c/UK114 family)
LRQSSSVGAPVGRKLGEFGADLVETEADLLCEYDEGDAPQRRARKADRVLRNLAAVLKQAGRSFDDVVSVRVFLLRMSDFALMNGVYTKCFNEPYPATTTGAVAELPLRANIEIDVVARG